MEFAKFSVAVIRLEVPGAAAEFSSVQFDYDDVRVVRLRSVVRAVLQPMMISLSFVASIYRLAYNQRIVLCPSGGSNLENMREDSAPWRRLGGQGAYPSRVYRQNPW